MIDEASLIKLRCMRTTLHVVPLDMAPVVHRATIWIRTRDVQRRLTALGFERNAWDGLRKIVASSLKKGPERYRNLLLHIATKLAASMIGLDSMQVARAAIKLSWEEGRICYVNRARRWESEDRWFDLTKRMYPQLNLAAISETEAVDALVEQYIRAYGPVLFEDLAWWSGISRSALGKCVGRMEHSERLLRLALQGWREDFFVLTEDWEALSGFEPQGERIALLGHEDPLLKAYALSGSRARYISRQHYHTLFNTIGEARSSVLRNGQVIGLWRWDTRRKRVVADLWKRITRGAQQQLQSETDELTAFLRDQPARV